MVSQMMAVVGQAQERIQACELSCHLRGLIFHGGCYTWKACKESWRGTGSWSWRNHWWLCLCILVLPVFHVKILWGALTVCGHLILALRYWHLRKAKWHRVLVHTPLYTEYQTTEYPLLLLTLKQAQILSVALKKQGFHCASSLPRLRWYTHPWLNAYVVWKETAWLHRYLRLQPFRMAFSHRGLPKPLYLKPRCNYSHAGEWVLCCTHHSQEHKWLFIE